MSWDTRKTPARIDPSRPSSRPLDRRSPGTSGVQLSGPATFEPRRRAGARASRSLVPPSAPRSGATAAGEGRRARVPCRSSRPAHARSRPRPETERDHFVGVRLSVDRLRVRRRRRRAPPKRVYARSRPCQKRCTGLDLPRYQPANSSSTSSVHSRMCQYRSTASRSYDAWSAILRERCRRWHGVGLLEDWNVDLQPSERRVQLLVEVGDGEPVGKLERLHIASVGRDNKAVIDEVEVDLESDAVFCVHAPGRQATHVDIERDVPPVVSRRGRGHAHLADDLRPEVQRVLRFLPLSQRKFRQTMRLLRRAQRAHSAVSGIVGDKHRDADAGKRPPRRLR